MDLSPLRDEVTFGLNRIYLLFEELGFPTTFLVAINRLVLEQAAQEVTAVDSTVFVNWWSRHHVPPERDPIYLRVTSARSRLLDGVRTEGSGRERRDLRRAAARGFTWRFRRSDPHRSRPLVRDTRDARTMSSSLPAGSEPLPSAVLREGLPLAASRPRDVGAGVRAGSRRVRARRTARARRDGGRKARGLPQGGVHLALRLKEVG